MARRIETFMLSYSCRTKNRTDGQSVAEYPRRSQERSNSQIDDDDDDDREVGVTKTTTRQHLFIMSNAYNKRKHPTKATLPLALQLSRALVRVVGHHHDQHHHAKKLDDEIDRELEKIPPYLEAVEKY